MWHSLASGRRGDGPERMGELVMMRRLINENDIGVLLDACTRGLSECYRILVEFAGESGWAWPSWACATDLDSVEDDSEELGWLADDALDYINEELVAAGLLVGWHESMLVCWSLKEWGELV